MSIKCRIGTEERQTPAYKERTLFVTGFPSFEGILVEALNNDTSHICLGTNNSFHPDDQWSELLHKFIQDNILVSLEHKESHTEWLKEHDLYENKGLILIGE